MWDVRKIFVHVRKIFVHVRRKNFFPSYVDKKFWYVDKYFSYVLALAIKLVYKSSASTYEKNLSTYEGKFCPSDVVFFAQNLLIHWEIWKLNFPHTKWVKTLVIFSKFEFQKNAQNLLIETQNNNYILHEKARQMKKTFCFNFCAYHCLWKNVSTSDLRFPQLPQ